MNEENLIMTAKEASRHSHSPYSRTRVGAAILTANGDVFSGCNIENSSYGLTICAERVALFNAVSSGHKSFKGIAIYSDSDVYPMPCGSCRQVLVEFAPEMEVLVVGRDGKRKKYVLEDLLKDYFRIE
ncbi:MAG: cytidine deaminase [Methanomassiliicoccales archaeon]|nr:MAG: cytidine deaminase [Methanomassiliicoccales archaeon]